MAHGNGPRLVFPWSASNLVWDFAWESSSRTRKLRNSILLLSVIRRSGTKVFTRLLPPKPNAIQWDMRQVTGFL